MARETEDGALYVAVREHVAVPSQGAFASEDIVVGTAVVTPTPSAYAPLGEIPARSCTIFLEEGSGGSDTDAIRIRYDGIDPTGSSGAKIPVSFGYFRLEGANNIANLKMIRATGTTVSPLVHLVYER